MNAHLPWSLIMLALLSACASGPTTQAPAQALPYSVPDHAMQPEAASGNTTQAGWAFRRQAVAAANPLATDAGHQVLRGWGLSARCGHCGADGAGAWVDAPSRSGHWAAVSFLLSL